jgi:hypothetical protein
MAQICPVGYQFPRRLAPPVEEAGEQDDWDANWLMISGSIRTADGREWAFIDPCLTTWEAARLSRWLAASAAQDSTEAGKLVSFTEPNISFTIDSYDSDRVLIRVRFSHESLPSWVPREPRGWQSAEYFLPLDVTCDQLAQAAQVWDLERAQFPAR